MLVLSRFQCVLREVRVFGAIAAVYTSDGYEWIQQVLGLCLSVALPLALVYHALSLIKSLTLSYTLPLGLSLCSAV